MFDFLKNAFVRGLVILIPIVILYVTIRELLEIMIGMATPIAELFPENTFSHDSELEIIAGLVIVGSAVLLGVLAAIKPVRLLGIWLERQILNPLPMYRMLKSLISAFLDLEDENSFQPAFLKGGDGSREPVYVVEDCGNNLVVVMQPWTPTPFAGTVKVVRRENIELLPVTLDEFSVALTHFGLGISDVMRKKTETEQLEV